MAHPGPGPHYNRRYLPNHMSIADTASQPDPTLPDVQRSERAFWALIATQFQGAYSDNILRNLLLAMVVDMGLGKDERDAFVSIVTFLFPCPS
jgi:hypothetical protein